MVCLDSNFKLVTSLCSLVGCCRNKRSLSVWRVRGPLSFARTLSNITAQWPRYHRSPTAYLVGLSGETYGSSLALDITPPRLSLFVAAASPQSRLFSGCCLLTLSRSIRTKLATGWRGPDSSSKTKPFIFYLKSVANNNIEFDQYHYSLQSCIQRTYSALNSI